MKTQRSVALIAFLVTGWIIASLALSGDIVQSTAPLGVGPLLTVLAATGGDIVLTAAIFILSLVLYWIIKDRKLLAEAVKDMFSRRKGKETRKSNRNLKRDMIGFIFFIAILIVVRSSGLLPPTPASKGSGSTAGSSFFIIPGFDGAVFQSSLLVAYHFLAVWAFQIIFFAITGICTIIFLRALAQLRAPEPLTPVFDEAVTRETIGVIQDVYRDLQAGDDYRRSILECYRRLCEVFEPNGSISHRQLTARELRERMIEQFRPAVQPISLLTSLFEEARYSSHQISAEMKDTAINALKEIEDCLRHPSEDTLAAIQ